VLDQLNWLIAKKKKKKFGIVGQSQQINMKQKTEFREKIFYEIQEIATIKRERGKKLNKY
jgi:hypothetical protein